MTTDELTDKMRAVAGQRWAGASQRQIDQHMRQMRAARTAGDNRKPRARRCPCQRMTLARAQARGRSREHARDCAFYAGRIGS